MKHALALAFVAGLALAGAAFAVDVYKWTDNKGVVHYGDRPASGVASRTVKVPDDALSPEDEAAANERLERARAQLAEPSPDVDPVPVVKPRKKAVSSSCTDAWAHFDAAQACYASHRAANGKGVSAAGLAVCRPMPQPTCER